MTPRTRRCLLLFLAPAAATISCGCVTFREWKWQQCYEGAQRPFDEISVLLVQPPLRVDAIDDVDVSKAIEYHLLPGHHVIAISVPGFITLGRYTTPYTPDPTPISGKFQAGYVYEVQYNVVHATGRINYLAGTIETTSWIELPLPLVELGTFDVITASDDNYAEYFCGFDAGKRHHVLIYVFDKPPPHWGFSDEVTTGSVSSEREETYRRKWAEEHRRQ